MNDGEKYERAIYSLLAERDNQICQNPLIVTQKPDFLVRIPNNNVGVIVECTSINETGEFPWTCSGEGSKSRVIDLSDSTYTNYHLRQALASKAKKYQELVEDRGYAFVVAVWDSSARANPERAIDTCYGRYNQSLHLSSDDGHLVGRSLERSPPLDNSCDSPVAFFEREDNIHVSAVLYSEGIVMMSREMVQIPNPDPKHLLIPNLNAIVPVPSNLFGPSVEKEEIPYWMGKRIDSIPY